MNDVHEINPQYTFAQLPFFISVKEFLDTPHGNVLEARAARFTHARSTISKETLEAMNFEDDRVLDFIYKKFLVDYAGVYNRWFLFSLFVMKPESIDEFRKIHDKLHTVMYYLNIREVRLAIDPFDLTMAKVLLLRQIDFFNLQLCNDKQFSAVGLLLSRYPSFRINQQQNIEIIAADDVQSLYAQNQELTRELDRFRQICIDQQRQIRNLTASLRQQGAIIDNLREQNLQANQVNQTLMQNAQQANQQVTELVQKSTRQQRDIEEKDMIIQELQANIEMLAGQNQERKREQNTKTPGLGQLGVFNNLHQENVAAKPAASAEPSLTP